MEKTDSKADKEMATSYQTVRNARDKEGLRRLQPDTEATSEDVLGRERDTGEA